MDYVWLELKQVCTREQGEGLDMKDIRIYWIYAWLICLLQNIWITNNARSMVIVEVWSECVCRDL